MNEGKRGFSCVICLFLCFTGSLNSLVPSLNVKKSSFSNGKLISYKKPSFGDFHCVAFWRPF